MKKMINLALLPVAFFALVGCATDPSVQISSSDMSDDAPTPVVEVPVIVPEQPNVVVVSPPEREFVAPVEHREPIHMPRPEIPSPAPFRKKLY